jgi:hypothetical protein
VALERNKQMMLTVVLKVLAVVLLTATASFAYTISPEIPAAQLVRAPDMPAKPQPFYIPVSVSPGCTLKLERLLNVYPLIATFGPSLIQPSTVGVTLMDSGVPLPVVPSTPTVWWYWRPPTTPAARRPSTRSQCISTDPPIRR